MGLFSSKKTAATLDSAAASLYRAGTKVAGETGGKVGDAIANATLGPIRSRNAHACTRSNCDHS